MAKLESTIQTTVSLIRDGDWRLSRTQTGSTTPSYKLSFRQHTSAVASASIDIPSPYSLESVARCIQEMLKLEGRNS